MKKRHLNEEGFSFLLVFLTIILVTVLGLGLLVVSANSLKTSSHEQEDQAIFYIAEAGLNYEKIKFLKVFNKAYADAEFAYLAQSPINPTSFEVFLDTELKAYNIPVTTNQVLEIDTRKLGTELFEKQIDKTPYAKIKIKRENSIKPDELYYSITSTGYFEENSIERTLKQDIIYDLLPGNPGSSGGSNGSTGNSNGSNNGHFSPNEFTVQTKGNITLTGGGKIDGDITNAGGKISVSGGGSITGNIGTSKENFVVDNDGLNYLKDQVTEHRDFPIGNILAPFPNEKMTELSKLNYPPNEELKVGNSNKTLIINNGNLLADNWMTKDYTLNLTENTHINQFKVDQNNTLTINVGDSDKDLYIDDLNILQGHIKIIGTGKLNIYVNNKLNIKGSFNAGGDASQVNFAYNGSSPLTFANETQIAGSLYAKNADLTFTGGVGVKGNIYTGGKNVTFDGGFNSNDQHIIAPNADVKVQAGAQIKGAIVADNLIVSGGASITFGNSTISPGPGGPSTPGGPTLPPVPGINKTEESILEIESSTN